MCGELEVRIGAAELPDGWAAWFVCFMAGWVLKFVDSLMPALRFLLLRRRRRRKNAAMRAMTKRRGKTTAAAVSPLVRGWRLSSLSGGSVAPWDSAWTGDVALLVPLSEVGVVVSVIAAAELSTECDVDVAKVLGVLDPSLPGKGEGIELDVVAVRYDAILSVLIRSDVAATVESLRPVVESGAPVGSDKMPEVGPFNDRLPSVIVAPSAVESDVSVAAAAADEAAFALKIDSRPSTIDEYQL